jgi:glutamate synthase domain-containing protein 3
MAGGIIIILGLYKKQEANLFFNKAPGIVGSYTGTGMHGGIIYIRGSVEDYKLGKEVKRVKLNSDDIGILNRYIKNYYKFFGLVQTKIQASSFLKLVPYSHRPYGNLYAY